MINGATDKLLPINAISPVDGRYWKTSISLSEYLSEYALMKYRVRLEIAYIIFLSKIRVATKMNRREMRKLKSISENFSIDDAEKIKKLEKETKHDVKAVEYFLRGKLPSPLTRKLSPWIHFALTSDDINNLSYRLGVSEALKDVIIPSLSALDKKLIRLATQYRSIAMLGRTHGQAAVPTTFGKELRVFQKRLSGEIKKLASVKLYGKFGGAVGNWNAHFVSFPEKNWVKLSRQFVKTLGLEHNAYTTQIAPAEDIVEIFHCLIRINNVLLGLNQDMWRYISDNWIVQKGKGGHVGSSTMPQKINPIEFENSEGNLIMANGLLETFARKLPISRLQRDLSESTILRNIGVSFAHSQIAYQSLFKGLATVAVNRQQIEEDLNKNWVILSEALQTILRKQGDPAAYEKIAAEVKNAVWTKEKWIGTVKALSVPKDEKKRLLALSPENYIGLAGKLANKYEKK